MSIQFRHLLPAASAASTTALVTFAALALLASPAADAHPHVWITYGAQVQVAQHKITGFREDWTFTKGFPAMLSIDLSHYPADGVLSDKDRDTFKQSAFDSLKRVGYFTRAFIDGKRLVTGEPKDFSVALHGGKLVYTFVLPLQEPVELPSSGFEFGVWDENYFVDFEMRAEGVQIDPPAAQCHITDVPDRDHPVFFGSVFPNAARIAC
jgi:ABC-type uncharacterized transport system substrate-binding protein